MGVCFMDGWHYETKMDGEHEVPDMDKKLVLSAEDGSYRPATEEDTESWNDLHHKQFATITPE